MFPSISGARRMRVLAVGCAIALCAAAVTVPMLARAQAPQPGEPPPTAGVQVQTVCFTVFNGTDTTPTTLYGKRYTNGAQTSQTPAIVLVHGIASSTANWDFRPDWSVARMLAARGFVVISYDRPGFARSPYAGDPATLHTPNQRADLHQLVLQVRHGTYSVASSDSCAPSVPKSQTALASPRAVIAGHSQGGSVVQGYPGLYHDVSAMIQADIGGPMITAPPSPIPSPAPTPTPVPDPVPPAPPGYSNFFNGRQACENFNIYWRGAVQDVVDVACDPTQFIVSPVAPTPADAPAAADLIRQTGNSIPILLTWGDHDVIAPIYNDELHYQFWLQNCGCDVSRMYLPETGHLFMAHTSLPLWIQWVTTWLTERGLPPTTAAGTSAGGAPSMAAAAPGPSSPPAPPSGATLAARAGSHTGRAARKACVVPHLKGLTLRAATAKLGAAGCDLGRRHTARVTGRRAGRVIAQSPRAHVRKRFGAKVTVTIARRARA